MSEVQLRRAGRSLIGFYSSLFVYLDDMLKALDKGESPSMVEVQSTLRKYFEEAKEANTLHSGEVGEIKEMVYTERNFELAQFAVVAFVDEKLISSSWSHRSEWLKNPLQKEYFSSTMAGSAFFENINSIRDLLTYEERDVYEIYYFCLAMGFEGAHYDSPDYLLDLSRQMYSRLSRYDEAHQNLQMRKPDFRKHHIREFRLNKVLVTVLSVGIVAGLVFLLYIMQVSAASDAVAGFLKIFEV